MTTTTAGKRTMTASEAAWVRRTAWRDHHRRDYATTPALHERCTCQYGGCGHCGAGHHECTSDRLPAAEHPATYLTDPRGYALGPVWEAGHRHAWTCSCKAGQHGHHGEQLAFL